MQTIYNEDMILEALSNSKNIQEITKIFYEFHVIIFCSAFLNAKNDAYKTMTKILFKKSNNKNSSSCFGLTGKRR